MPPRVAPLAALCLLAACSEPQKTAAAVAEPGVCFRLQDGVATVVERGVANLETCAARLEVLRQQENAAVEGRYQTVRIYVDEKAIDAAREDGAGPRFRVFEPANLTQLRKATANRLAAEAAPRRTGPPVAEGLPPAPARTP